MKNSVVLLQDCENSMFRNEFLLIQESRKHWWPREDEAGADPEAALKSNCRNARPKTKDVSKDWLQIL